VLDLWVCSRLSGHVLCGISVFCRLSAVIPSLTGTYNPKRPTSQETANELQIVTRPFSPQITHVIKKKITEKPEDNSKPLDTFSAIVLN